MNTQWPVGLLLSKKVNQTNQKLDTPVSLGCAHFSASEQQKNEQGKTETKSHFSFISLVATGKTNQQVRDEFLEPRQILDFQ